MSMLKVILDPRKLLVGRMLESSLEIVNNLGNAWHDCFHYPYGSIVGTQNWKYFNYYLI